MKKLLIAAVAALAMWSCGSKDASYTITGKAIPASWEGKQVLLNKLEDNGPVAIDTATITKGAFEFKGKVEQPVMYMLSLNLGENKHGIPAFVVVENANIAVEIDSASYKISGTATNDALQKYNDDTKPLHEQMRDLNVKGMALKEAGKMTPAIGDSLSNIYGKLDSTIHVATKAFATANINNPAGQFQLRSLVPGASGAELKELIAGADTTALKSEAIVRITDRITALEKVAEGQMFTDLRMPNPEGKEVALSDYAGKGKVVLIDFWASWCPPCRASMPGLVQTYAKYKSKGFEIVGVSFDKEHDAWVKGIKDLKLTWPQMSDIKYFQSEGAKLYAVSGIPHTVLLDKTGKIVAKDLHGAELDAKIEELLK